MYQVIFEELVQGRHLDNDATCLQGIVCSDFERALALAGLLSKLCTDSVQYVKMSVQPYKLVENETSEK